MLHVLAEVITEREPKSDWFLLEDRRNARVLRDLRSIAYPSEEPDTYWELCVCSDIERLPRRPERLFQLL